MAEPFIAEVRIWALNFAPRGWAFCNGQLLQIAQNTAVFSLVGTTYGGDGRTTMGLPNLEGRTPMHWGTGPGLTQRKLGEGGGAAAVTLNTTQMPNHRHTMQAAPAPGDDDDAKATAVLAATPGANIYGASAGLSPLGAGALPEEGGGGSHNNLQPYLSLNFCIALVGTYPQRS